MAFLGRINPLRFVDYLRKKLRPNVEPVWFGEHAQKIGKAFTVGGVDYFMFRNEGDLPVIRGFEAVDIYNNMRIGLTYDQLRVALVSQAQSAKKREYDKWAEQTNLLLDCMADGRPQLEQIYELASVIYFDKTEDPYNYSAMYAKEKIAHWKKYGADGFFLKFAIKDLGLSSMHSTGDIATFMLKTTQERLSHLRTVAAYLSKIPDNSELHATLLSEMETLLKSQEYINSEFLSTTTIGDSQSEKPNNSKSS